MPCAFLLNWFAIFCDLIYSYELIIFDISDKTDKLLLTYSYSYLLWRPLFMGAVCVYVCCALAIG